jgi:hypothetical protein
LTNGYRDPGIDHLRALAKQSDFYELESDKASDVINSKYLQTDQATTFGL